MSRIELDLGCARGDLELTWQCSSAAAWLGLFGPSGRGKTTALELLLGWLEPLPGRNQRLVPSAERVGYAAQDLLLFPHWTVGQNLAAAAEDSTPLPRGLRQRMLVALGLDPILGRSASALSGGEGRRVALGRALLKASTDGLLLLDEPLASLDSDRRRTVLGFLLEFQREREPDAKAIVVSHSAIDLAVLCDAVQVLETAGDADGHRRSRFGPAGPPSEVLAEEGGYDNLLHGLVEALHGDAAAVRLESGAEVRVPGRGLLVGERVVLGLSGDDVLVSLADPGMVSARNVLVGEIVATQERRSFVTLSVAIEAGLVLHTHVTADALSELDLVVGRRVHLLFKTRSMRVLARA